MTETRHVKLDGTWYTVEEASQMYPGSTLPEDSEGFPLVGANTQTLEDYLALDDKLSEIEDLHYGPLDPDMVEAIVEWLYEQQGDDPADWTVTEDDANPTRYVDWADYAEQLCSDVYDLDKLPELLRYAIDWDSVGETLRSEEWRYIESNGGLYVFND